MFPNFWQGECSGGARRRAWKRSGLRRTLNATVSKVDNLVWLPSVRKRENWSRGPTVEDFCAGTHGCPPKIGDPRLTNRGPRVDLRPPTGRTYHPPTHTHMHACMHTYIYMYRERERGGSGPKAVFRDEGPERGGRHVASNLSPSFSLSPSLSSNPRQFFETKDLDQIGVIHYDEEAGSAAGGGRQPAGRRQYHSWVRGHGQLPL